MVAYPSFQTAYQGNYNPPGMMLVPVQNEGQVNNYLVASGTTVAFADINNGLLWLKSTAANGLPEPVRKFELTEITPKPEAPAETVSREEFSAMDRRFDDLNAKFDKLLSELTGGKKHEHSARKRAEV